MSGYSKMSRKEVERIQRAMLQENTQWPEQLVDATPEQIQSPESGQAPYKVMRSRFFMVQLYQEAKGIIRLSVNRTELTSNGSWKGGISWDELQSLKNQAGFEAFDALEIYPAAEDVVNVSNMRHLWVVPGKLPIGWRR